jgi:hypothetical protein
MKGSRGHYSSGTSSKVSSSPTTPLMKKQRRIIIDESPLSQSEVSWFTEESSQLSPHRQFPIRTKSSSQLTATPVRIVKRHVSSPAIGSVKVKHLFDFDESIDEKEEDEAQLKKENSFTLSCDEFDFSDDQLVAVLDKVDEEEKLQGKSQMHPAVAAAASVDCNFEDSFDDAILASIPLDELSKFDKANVEIIYEGGLSQIVEPPKVLAKNKSMEPRTEHITAKRPLERHQSLPQQPLANSTNGKQPFYNLSGDFHPHFHEFFSIEFRQRPQRAQTMYKRRNRGKEEGSSAASSSESSKSHEEMNLAFQSCSICNEVPQTTNRIYRYFIRKIKICR